MELLPLFWVHVKEKIIISVEELVQVTGKWIQTNCFHFICTCIRFLQCRLMVLLCELSFQKESVQSRKIGGGYCIGINA